MKMNYKVLFATLFVFVMGCTMVQTHDIEFKTVADPKVNFSGYKSYTWAGSAMILNDPLGQWEPAGFDADKEIRFLINRELREYGLSESSVKPDLYVVYAAGIDMAALGFKENPETEQKFLSIVPKGGLAVFLVDASTRYIIWAGGAVAEVQKERTPETAKARLDYAVTQMLKKLPQRGSAY